MALSCSSTEGQSSESMQVAVDQAAQASPTGNLARKARAVFTNAAGVVQAAAALRRYTVQRARSAQETLHGQACTADAGLVKEHQEMLKRYQVHLSATAMESYAGMDEQVWHTPSISFSAVDLVALHLRDYLRWKD
jgi:hypothetical protein